MNPSDLDANILKLLDGDLTAEEIAALEVELLDSVEARETYRKLARMHSALETRHTSIATVGSLRLIPIDRILDRQRKRIIRISLSAAAALVLISTLILSLMRLPDAPIASFQTPPGAVFKLTHESEGNAPPEGNVLTKGSRLQLLSGALEANFQSGVRAVIEAPSDLRVLEIDHVELMKGMSLPPILIPQA